jgi:hypothetical protein
MKITARAAPASAVHLGGFAGLNYLTVRKQRHPAGRSPRLDGGEVNR